MKFFSTCTVAILLLSNTPALAHPQPVTDIQPLSTREREVVERDNAFEDVKDLWKRKGGGGGGGKGGSGSSGSSGGKGGSGGSGGSSSGYVPSSPGIGGVSGSLGSREPGTESSTSYWSARTSTSKGSVGGSSSSMGGLKRVFAGSFSGGRGRIFSSGRGSRSSSSSKSNKHSSSIPKGSGSSNIGGTTRQGSGVTPNYGGGRYYGGGATTPYTAGSRSPLGIAAIPLAFGAGALAFYPGLWLYGAYAYPYGHVSDYGSISEGNSLTND